MKFLILIINLVLFKYFHIGKNFHRFNWVDNYISDLSEWTKKIGRGNFYLELMILLAPIIFSLFFFNFILSLINLDIVKFLFSFFIVLYCLDPENIILNKGSKEDNGEGDEAENLSYRYFQAYFSPLFWYIIFGVFGILTYRILERLYNSGKISQVFAENYEVKFLQLLNIIEWIPSRIMAFSYCLTGHFNPCFEFIRKNFKELSARNFLLQAEKAASSQTDKLTGQNYYNYVLSLIERTFVLFLILFALSIIKDAF